MSNVRVGELPSALFNLSDNLAHEIGTDLKRGTVQELINLIAPLLSALQFQVIELDVNIAYINSNFDASGLGTNLCLGYAICNGNNGTKNRNGLVSLGYGVGYTAIGGTSGSKDAVLVAHSHTIIKASNDADGTSFSPGNGSLGTESTSIVGVSGIDKNMQPYIVTLMIQKL